LYPWYARIVLRIFIVILSGHWSRPGERSIKIFEQLFLDYLEESGRCWSKCLPEVLFIIHFRSDLKLGIIGSRFCNFFIQFFPLRQFISSNFKSFITLKYKLSKDTSKNATSAHHHSFSFPTFAVSQCRCLKRF
jgi:hypothetical protein